MYCSKYCHTTISHQCKLLIDLNIMSHVTDNFYVLNFAMAKNLTFYTPLLVNESVQCAVLAAISLFGFSENAVSLPIYYPSKMKIHIWKQTTVYFSFILCILLIFIHNFISDNRQYNSILFAGLMGRLTHGPSV